MPRSQTPASRLTKLLEHAPDPIYVLDDLRTIVFCNRALAAWTGVEAAALVGRRVDYHSHVAADDGDETEERAGVAVGLCPPPAALAGEETTGHVSCMSSAGRLLHRRARFVPIGAKRGGRRGDVDCHGVVVFLEPIDREAGSLASGSGAEPTTDQLHLAIRRFRRDQANRYELDRLLGDSPAIRRAREQVALAVQCRASVLITGPPGSGRAHVARAIHYGSRESPGSLVPVCCDRLDGDVLASTIDSVVAERKEHAQATLLLEDVDRLAGEDQVRLAAFAGEADGPRLIATSRMCLGRLAEEGRFRHDLACALGTITISLPPLAERIEDLPILAQMFLEEENRAGGKQLGGIAPDVVDLLASYPWSHGLDELAAAVRDAHQVAAGPEITLADLPEKFRHAASATARPRLEEESIVLEDFLAGVETELIRRALGRARGNKTKAAKMLGMTRPRFYRRLEQLGIADNGVDEDAEADAAATGDGA